MKKNISKFHFEILTEDQKKVIENLRKFSKYGALGGGTALALQLYHRKSFDFDIFTPKPLSKKFLYKIKEHFKKIEIIINTGDELSFISPFNVKISFIFYPFKNFYKTIKTSFLDIFDWRDIGLDKAHAIGRRGEWRDYIDLYFVIKNGLTLEDILQNSKRKFRDSFSGKLFLSQLCYYGDIVDFSVELLDKRISITDVQNFFEKEIRKINF